MSTAVDAPDAPVTLRPAGDRGTLTIADRVIEKVAVAAAGEINGVLPAPTGGLGRVFHPGRQISAGATQPGGSTDAVELTLELSVRYPLPVRTTAIAVRRHVSERVLQLTGRPLSRVTIAVTHLTHPGEERPSRVQ